MDRARKRQLRKAYKTTERDAVAASLPMSSLDMRALLDFLDLRLSKNSCDKSRRLTIEHLQTRGHDVESVCLWLDQHGGFCDCEVLANCEPVWEDATHGQPPGA